MKGLLLQLKFFKIGNCYKALCFTDRLFMLIVRKRKGENASGNKYYSMQITNGTIYSSRVYMRTRENCMKSFFKVLLFEWKKKKPETR